MSSLAIRAIKQERAAKTREDILEAAILVFSKHGFLGTSMVQLAKTIRMTPGALYWHFATKEDLLLAALEELNLRFLREFEPLTQEARSMTAVAQLDFFLDRTERFFHAHPAYGRFLAMLTALAPEANARVSQALRVVLEAYAGAVAHLITWGQQKAREFRDDVDPLEVGHLLVSTFCGFVLHHALFEGDVSFEGLGTTLKRIASRGISKVGVATGA